MNPILDYFLKNFFLLCMTFGVIFMVLRNNSSRRAEVWMPICIVATAVFISIVYAIELEAQKHEDMVFLATFCFFLGFAARPLYVLFFLKLTEDNKIITRIGIGAVIVNALIYALSLFIHVPTISHAIFWYDFDAVDGVLKDSTGPLFYFAYIVVGIMTAYLIFTSIRSLKGRHRFDALASLICVAFIGGAVIIESLKIANNLLNTTVAIACLFYVVHLFQQASNKDILTNLFNRSTYYADERKLGNRVTGMILVDMNCLKYINDNYGHLEGDRAISSIAHFLDKASDNAMYVYRLGGDEFLVMSTSQKPGVLEAAVKQVKANMDTTPYTVSMGYCYRTSPEQTNLEIFKKAEELMYEDKKAFYIKNGFDRRRRPLPEDIEE